MARKKESVFSAEAVKRQQEQKKIQQKVGLNRETKKTGTRKRVSTTVTLPMKYKEKLVAHAKERNLPISILVQLWIEQHCS